MPHLGQRVKVLLTLPRGKAPFTEGNYWASAVETYNLRS
jgi:hypothetical protein